VLLLLVVVPAVCLMQVESLVPTLFWLAQLILQIVREQYIQKEELVAPEELVEMAEMAVVQPALLVAQEALAGLVVLEEQGMAVE
jgi:hypothetical protein